MDDGDDYTHMHPRQHSDLSYHAQLNQACYVFMLRMLLVLSMCIYVHPYSQGWKITSHCVQFVKEKVVGTTYKN